CRERVAECQISCREGRVARGEASRIEVQRRKQKRPLPPAAGKAAREDRKVTRRKGRKNFRLSSAAAGVSESKHDGGLRLRARPGGGQLSECVHPADSSGGIHRAAALALPQVREADCAVRQCAAAELAGIARALPELQDADFRAVSRG